MEEALGCARRRSQIGANGVLLDEAGWPVVGADGRTTTVHDPRVPPGGRIVAGGLVVDAAGQPVLTASGKPIHAEPHTPAAAARCRSARAASRRPTRVRQPSSVVTTCATAAALLVNSM